MTTAELERTTASLVKEAMERIEQPSPTAIAELVLQELDDERVRHFAIRGMAEYVRKITHQERNGHHSIGKGQTPQSARWDNVAEAQKSGELELTRFSVWTGEQHKWLLDCAYADLIAAADHHTQLASTHEASAEQLNKLANLLRRNKASTVADLPTAKVEKIVDA
jgi:hypothetical protein